MNIGTSTISLYFPHKQLGNHRQSIRFHILVKNYLLSPMFEMLSLQSLTCELHTGLAADQHAVVVLCSAVILSSIGSISIPSLLEAAYQECAVGQDLRPTAHSGKQWSSVLMPRHCNGTLAFHPAVQHQWPVPYRDNITGLS